MVIKNFFFLSLGEILGRFFSFLAILYIARKIDIINFGQINFALSYITYFSLLTNLGLVTLGIRKIAQGMESKEVVNKIFSLRLILGILVTILALLFINLLKEEITTRNLILFYSFFILLDAINLEWFFLGKEEVKYCSLNRLISNFFYFLFLLIFLKSNQEILSIPLSFISGIFFGVFFLFFSYYQKFAKVSFQLNWKETLFLLKEALPLGSAQILIQIYTLSSIVTLGVLKMKEALGYYSAGFRPILVLMIFDRVFNQIILPFLTKKFKENNFRIINNILRLTLIFVIPFNIFLFLVAEKLFIFLFPLQYLSGKIVFQILLGFFVFTFLNSIFSLSLIALKKDFLYFQNILLGTIVNIFLVIFLTKNFHHSGAALAVLITEFLIFLLNFLSFEKFYKINFLSLLPLPLIFISLTFLLIFLLHNAHLLISIFSFLLLNFCLLIIFKKEIWKDICHLK